MSSCARLAGGGKAEQVMCMDQHLLSRNLRAPGPRRLPAACRSQPLCLGLSLPSDPANSPAAALSSAEKEAAANFRHRVRLQAARLTTYEKFVFLVACSCDPE